jgi:transcriptional regulator with XRE-family HTH domain
MRGIVLDAGRLRRLRLARGLTQIELALSAGVAERTVRHAEHGRPIRPDFAKFLAVALGAELADLMEDPGDLRRVRREQRNVQQFLGAVDAWANRYDWIELKNLVMRNCLFRSPYPAMIPFSGEFRGLDGLKHFFELSSTSIAYHRPPVPIEIRTSGNLVIIDWVDWLHVASTGKSLSAHATHILQYEKGRLTRIDNLPYANEISMVIEAFTSPKAERTTMHVNREHRFDKPKTPAVGPAAGKTSR